MKHPSVYSNNLLPIFAEILNKYGSKCVLDPFAGTGKIALIRAYGFVGEIHCSEIEPEWPKSSPYNVDHWNIGDSENLSNIYEANKFDAICTSVVYGNRMSDHHKSNDKSRRVSYRQYLGRDLTDGNIGKMQWGEKYRLKHSNIYKELYKIIKPNGIFILNVSDHIRSGEVMPVSQWHVDELTKVGLKLVQTIEVQTQRMKYGENRNLRVSHENVFVLEKL